MKGHQAQPRGNKKSRGWKSSPEQALGQRKFNSLVVLYVGRFGADYPSPGKMCGKGLFTESVGHAGDVLNGHPPRADLV